MLSLDDPRWQDLRHAYGAAGDIPDLLGALASATAPKTDYEDEPWFSLWSSLCHQGDVYTASYAAVPHIVAIALRADPPIDFCFLQLPAAIEIARASGKGPAVPDDCAGAYRRAIASLPECVNRHGAPPWSEAMLLSAAAALAVAHGHAAIGEAMLNLDDYWIGKINDFDTA